MRNPTVLASGVLGVSAAILARVAVEGGAGAVTTKSCSLKPRKGHSNPVMLSIQGGFINAVGLSNPGAAVEAEEIAECKKLLVKANVDAPVIASLFGETASEFGEVAAVLASVKPSLLEANVSCPNVENEFGSPFAFDPDAVRKVVESIKTSAPRVPLAVKLSPNAPNLIQVALAAQEAGADAITAMNTLGPGMVINAEARAPVLSNKTGGVSGAALKPIALRCVYALYDSLEIPIIGTGGVQTGRDAVEMMMAGATAVGIGTGVYSRGIRVFGEVARELSEWLESNGFSKASELTGLAHENQGKRQNSKQA